MNKYYKYHDILSLTTNGEYIYEYNFNNSSSSDLHIWRKCIPFFIKPDLEIIGIESHENTDKRWDKNDEGKYPIRKFINIKVKNKGKNPAIQCQAKLRVIDKITKCISLSDNDEKFLLWDNQNLKRDIGIKYDEAYFHLIFSQYYLTKKEIESISPIYCGVIDDKTKFQTWIGTRDALSNPTDREQDGICEGKFKIHVDVFSIYGNRVYSDFIITVGKNWHDLEINKIDCKCINETRWTQLRNRFRRTK